MNTDPNYTTPEPLQIPEGTRIPSLSIHEVQYLLLNQKRSSSGPDNLPYWFWKSFAIELAPIVTEIFNMSLKTSKVPQKWKSANLLPLPKESPLNSCNHELLETFGLRQHVNVPTHSSGHTLVLIITRSCLDITITEPTTTSLLSDHLFVECKLDVPRPNLSVKELRFRKLKQINLNSFKDDILSSELYSRTTWQDIN